MIVKHYILSDTPGTPYKVVVDHPEVWRLDRIFTIPSGWFIRLSSAAIEPPDPKPLMKFFPANFCDPVDSGPDFPFQPCDAERYTSALRLLEQSGWPQP